MELTRGPLIGRRLRLEPVTDADRAATRDLLNRDAEFWQLASANGMGDGFDGWWSGAMDGAARNGWITWLIRQGDRVIGTSSYLNVKPADKGVEIGSTFLHPDVRGGAVNPESKRLLLAHAFDAGALRVEFMVDSRNTRSQAAVTKLGATREGVLRRNRITWTGHVRDTVVFSVLVEEWPAVRDRLDARLADQR
jgi:RimJ/RimL family protein N-acetyltransferase